MTHETIPTTPAMDAAYAALVQVDRLLVAAALPAWQPPRSHLLSAFDNLQRCRSAVVALSKATDEIGGPSCDQPETGDDDRGASLHTGEALGSSAASAAACDPCDGSAIPPPHPEADAPTWPQVQHGATYPDIAV